jgi:hypothetical protein
MVKIIHCPSCYQISEIRSDNEAEMFSPPTYCPFCGYQEEPELLVEDPDMEEDY